MIFVNVLMNDVDEIDNEEYEKMFDEMFHYIEHITLDYIN